MPRVVMASARDIIETLGLSPHPEGGWFRETWRAPAGPDGRATATAIHYLLEADQHSRWHRVDAGELWLWHAGGPLALTLSRNGDDAESAVLGAGIAIGQRPQVLVPARCWQTAAPLGAFALVSCVVSPGFEFDGFEMAPPDWRPTSRPAGGR